MSSSLGARLPSLTGLRFAAALLVFGVHAYSFIPVDGLAHRVGHYRCALGDDEPAAGAGVVPDEVTYLGINSVAWSLSCEMAFYAAFPLLYLLLRRVRALYAVGAGLLAVALLMPAIADALVGDAHRRWFVYVFPLARMVEFAVGVVLALLVRRGVWRGPGLPVASALWVANYLAVDLLPDRIRDTSAVLATTALLIPAAALADLRGSPSPWRGGILVSLGEASYAFFLVHLTVLTVGMQFLGREQPYPLLVAILLALGFLAVSYALAFALHRWVEVPAMRLGKGVLAGSMK